MKKNNPMKVSSNYGVALSVNRLMFVVLVWKKLNEQFDSNMEVATNNNAASDIVTELINGKEGFRVHVNVPTASDVEAYLVRRRKQELMDRYATED
jgi:chromosome condensin MukBEF complex kleisin-like MukF subunit